MNFVTTARNNLGDNNATSEGADVLREVTGNLIFEVAAWNPYVIQ